MGVLGTITSNKYLSTSESSKELFYPSNIVLESYQNLHSLDVTNNTWGISIGHIWGISTTIPMKIVVLFNQQIHEQSHFGLNLIFAFLTHFQPIWQWCNLILRFKDKNNINNQVDTIHSLLIFIKFKFHIRHLTH